MSWDQGVTPREDLTDRQRALLDGLGKGPVEYITWFGNRPASFVADYGERGALTISIRKEPDE